MCASVCDSCCASPPPLYFLVWYQISIIRSVGTIGQNSIMCVCLEFYVLKGLSAPLTQTKQIYLVKKG